MTAFTGTRALARLILRRDRVVMPLWVLVLAILPATYTSAIASSYPTAESLERYYRGILENAAELAYIGPVFGSSAGALGAWRAGILFTLVALASLLTVIRHTRTEEEAGRRELVGSAVVGRHAPLAAALLVTFTADLVLAAVVAATMARQDVPASGGVALGLGLAASGWIFGAVGGVAAQLATSATTARGLAMSALGLAFLLRAAGDAGGPDSGVSWLSWLSPLGWGQRVRPFAGERWWLLALCFAVALVLAAAAYPLSQRRDVGAGVLPPRLGPAAAAPAFRSPLALAWRLHRGLLLAWTAGFVVVGAVIGGSAKSVRDQLPDSSQALDIMERLGGHASLTDIYLAALLNFLGIAAAGYTVQAALRLRAEETSGRAEPVLATAVNRVRWAASHLVFSALGPAVVLTALGLAAGLTFGLSTGDVGHELPRVLAGALVQLPAVWVLTGLAVALFGLLPRYAVASWVALAGCLLIGQVGAVLQWSQWALDVSPFIHVPRVPGGAVSAAPLAALLGLAAALTATGLAGFRRRDVVA